MCSCERDFCKCQVLLVVMFFPALLTLQINKKKIVVICLKRQLVTENNLFK